MPLGWGRRSCGPATDVTFTFLMLQAEGRLQTAQPVSCEAPSEFRGRESATKPLRPMIGRFQP